MTTRKKSSYTTLKWGKEYWNFGTNGNLECILKYGPHCVMEYRGLELLSICTTLNLEGEILPQLLEQKTSYFFIYLCIKLYRLFYSWEWIPLRRWGQVWDPQEYLINGKN